MYWNCKPVFVYMAASNDEVAKAASDDEVDKDEVDEVATSAPPSMAQSISEEDSEVLFGSRNCLKFSSQLSEAL